jgi:class 3 adenylate cyclase/tetratricopeptide (TPR) repeat protein
MAETRKTVTIVFADVTGSTALGEQTDPEVMRRIMERYFEEMRSVLEKHGGTVEKFIGDAVMAVFGIPAVHEDDALRAVRAAAEMRERLAALNDEFEHERGITIVVRTGVNTGEVVAGDASSGQAFATGDAVNVAARLEQAADPGEILIGPLTRELVRAAVRAEEVEPLELKGKAQQIEAWRLTRVFPDVPAYTRRIDAPLVGRKEELARLTEAFDAATSEATCQLVTVVGAPGIGKSRLVRELITAIGDEAQVLVGRCLSYGDGITYWPLAEMIRQVAGTDPRPTLLELLGQEPEGAVGAERLLGAIGAADQPARTEEIFWAARILFERLARDRPLTVVVDDIHWAEPTLLDLIEYVAGFARGPILIACTARADLFDQRPHWSRAGAVELEPLDEQEAVVLMDALLAEAELSPKVRDRIRERAEGNPLFVEQMLALASENGNGDIAVPATIQALLAARLDHLSDEERGILVRGAVEGRLFHRGAVSTLVTETERNDVPGRLLALARKNFIKPDESLFLGDDAYRFVHVLVRDAAYDAAPKELRAELHERFAAWLEAKASTRLSELEEILGYHLEKSFRYREALGERAEGVARRAGERLAAAGERAARRGDHRATINLLARALKLLPPADRRTLELSFTLNRSYVEAGELDQAGKLLIETSKTASELGLEALQMTTEIELALLRVQTDPMWLAEEARSLIQRALPVLEAAGDDQALARAWVLVDRIESIVGRLGAAEEAARKALDHARRTGDPRLIADAYASVCSNSWYGHDSLTELLPIHQEFYDWARRIGHRVSEGQMLVAFGRIKFEQGDEEGSEALVERGLDLLEDLGLPLSRAAMDAWYTWGDLASRPESVEARVRAYCDALKAVGETGYFSTQAANLALTLARRGEIGEAEQLSQESEAAGSKDDLVTQIGWRMARATVLARRGNLREAETLARSALALALGSDYAAETAETHVVLADVLRIAGHPDQAAQELEQALRIFERKEFAASADAVRAELAALQSSGSPSQ